ncbi:MAG: transposase [Deltaproteobacteria bacterium]|nr:transposase [Deltaproteobacteria bacterium]
MNSTEYSREFKDQAVAKVLAPGAPSLTVVAKKIGVPYTTLFGWKRRYVNKGSMKKSKNKKTNSKWTPELKFKAIFDTMSLSEHELGEYLRKNGLHSSQIEEWKQESMSGLKSAGRPKIDPEVLKLRQEKKSLEKNLLRKDKALAEMSSRVILLKKSHEIFGENEDEE